MIFATYEDPANGKRTLVKLGFSWPGFFFGPAWALAKGMLTPGIVGLLALGDLIALLDGNLGVAALIGFLVLGTTFGLFGNRWLSVSLEHRGYAYKGSQHCG